MKYKQLPDYSFLHSILDYRPDTGLFYWKCSDNPKISPGAEAGTVLARGYVHIKIREEQYKAHRLAFKMVTGRDPVGGIDHADGNPTNNAFSNLRESDQTYNNANTQFRKDNKSGVKGVCLHEVKGFTRWKAQWSEIGGARKARYFPYTSEGLAAAEEFIKAKRRELYGEFANDGEHRDTPV